eukprot:m.83320 g.83320  ORF g.83320 m.83320 type:complete len:66 (+) comp9530_c0_seq2:1655-1852(+)
MALLSAHYTHGCCHGTGPHTTLAGLTCGYQRQLTGVVPTDTIPSHEANARAQTMITTERTGSVAC